MYFYFSWCISSFIRDIVNCSHVQPLETSWVPCLGSSSRAVRPASSNTRTDTLDPVSSRSICYGCTLWEYQSLFDCKDKKISLQSSTPTPLSPANSMSCAFKPNSFKDAKQARESAKPSHTGAAYFVLHIATRYSPSEGCFPSIRNRKADSDNVQDNPWVQSSPSHKPLASLLISLPVMPGGHFEENSGISICQESYSEFGHYNKWHILNSPENRQEEAPKSLECQPSTSVSSLSLLPYAPPIVWQ